MAKKDKNEGEVKKKSGILKKILIFLLIILVLLAGFIGYKIHSNGGGLQGLLLTLVGNDLNELDEMDEIQVLVMGVSTDNGGKLTDTIIVASYDPKTQDASLLSIPRDTFVGKNKANANAYEKINALYQKSPEKTLEAVNNITGLNLEYYVVVDNEALIKLVDLIGGVDFDVPINMVYDDPSQNLHINLKKGMQKINGEKAEQLLRFRHGNPDKNGRMSTYPEEYGDNDLGRMRTQRAFITETIKQTIKAKNIFKLKDMIDIGYKYIETNVPVSVIKDYVPYAVNVDVEGIDSEVLPGATAQLGPQKLWFFEVNKTETKELINKLYFSDETENDDSTTMNSSEKTNEKTTDNTEKKTENTTNNSEESTNSSDNKSEKASNNTEKNTTSAISKSEASKIKIEILDGSGSSKALSEVKKALTSKGYKVTRVTSTTNTAKTTIINKTDIDEKYEKDIKNILNTENVSNSSVSSSKVDITIIIGKDYK